MNAPAPSPPAWACVLTPEGRGAIAVVRIWGPGALGVADAAFRPARGKPLAQTEPGQLRFGRMGAGLGDEVVALVLPGQPAEVEVQCHGGPAASQMVLDALVAGGTRRARPAAWMLATSRTRLVAEARYTVAQAPTVRCAEILMDQAGGALDCALSSIKEQSKNDPPVAIASLEHILAHASLGLRLVAGWRIALAGRPNVGKSRLLNALAGYDRAIVDATPGTTRDVVTVRTAFNGWPAELADTAGLRETFDPAEAAGVARAHAEQAQADLVLLVLDRSEPLRPEDRSLVARYPHALRVANKSDLPAAWDPHAPGCLTVSAATGDGLSSLFTALTSRLVPQPLPVGAAVPFRRRHVRYIEQALNRLATGKAEEACRLLDRLLRPVEPQRH